MLASARASVAFLVLLLRGEVVLPAQQPTPAEVLSGKALNVLLRDLVKAHARGQRGPRVSLDAGLLRDVNLARPGDRPFGVLKNGGKLNWPVTFGSKRFRDDRA